MSLTLSLFFSFFWESESVCDSLLPTAVKGNGGGQDIGQRDFLLLAKTWRNDLLCFPRSLLWLEVPPGRPAAQEMMLIDWINQDVWRKQREQVEKQRDFSKWAVYQGLGTTKWDPWRMLQQCLGLAAAGHHSHAQA